MNKTSILIAAVGFLWFYGESLQAQPLARYTFDNGAPSDITGNGMDGVLLGNAEIVTDSDRGQVLQINQSGMQADGPFEITTSFTLAAWVKLDVPRTGRYYFGGPWWIRTDNQAVRGLCILTISVSIGLELSARECYVNRNIAGIYAIWDSC